MSRLSRWSIALVALGSLGLAGCSSSTASSTTTSPPSSTTSSSAATPTTGAAAAVAPIPLADRSPAGTAGTAPTVVVPTSAPPTQLESADLITGSGPAVTNGDSITVQYVLATYSTHQVVQSSWTSQPFTFTVGATGAGSVIPGWDQGVIGMQAGGRRELIIPPSLGYGNSSPGAGIAADDTLVFVIDLVKIN